MLNHNFKKILTDIIFIIFISAVLALLYNYFSPKPMSLIYEAPKIEYVSDSEFYINNNFNNNLNNNNLNYNPVQSSEKNNSENIDSIQKKSNSSEKNSNDIISQKNDPNSNNSNSNNKLNTESNKIELNNKESDDGKIKYVSYEQVLKQLENPDVLLIDARSPEKYSESHIGKAINIFPFLEEREYMDKIRNVPQNKIIIVYCDGGSCESSRKVADDLKNFGYKRILLYEGGWEDWTKHK